jgi:hypothetical protein
LEVQKRYYPFLVAVKDYGVNFLEYWCQDITVAEKEVLINASIDKLEIYGLYCFRIKGAFPALTVYFRPMSLVKYLKCEVDISPNVNDDSIKASINGEKSKILTVNRVEEYGGEQNLQGFLMQISMPSKGRPEKDNFLDVQVTDSDGHFGQASIFFLYFMSPSHPS